MISFLHAINHETKVRQLAAKARAANPLSAGECSEAVFFAR
jgi:hypothetical protein